MKNNFYYKMLTGKLCEDWKDWLVWFLGWLMIAMVVFAIWFMFYYPCKG